MPDLWRAYGEMLHREDGGITLVFVTLTAIATALFAVFAIGYVLGRVRKAWRRARQVHTRGRP